MTKVIFLVRKDVSESRCLKIIFCQICMFLYLSTKNLLSVGSATETKNNRLQKLDAMPTFVEVFCIVGLNTA